MLIYTKTTKKNVELIIDSQVVKAQKLFQQPELAWAG